MGTLDRVATMAGGAGVSIGETYVLGDSPLVLLTALTSSFQPWPASSESRLLPAPVWRTTARTPEPPCPTGPCGCGPDWTAH